MTPRLSVLLPVRNGLPWLEEALASLARQTMRNFEILALEDGSTDGTAEFLRRWPDSRLRIISTGGVGMAGALNLGLDAARAPFVARHDADDVSAPLRFAAQLDWLSRHTDIDVVASTADYIDAHGRPVVNAWVKTVRRQQDAALTPRQIAELMPLTCCITHGSVMARTAVLHAAGGYRTNIWPVEDYDLWLRLLPGTAIAKLPHRLYRYRIHDAQLSACVRDAQLEEALSAKLRFIRRMCPAIASPARLVVVGDGRGADAYKRLAPVHDFELVPSLDGSTLPPVRSGGASEVRCGGASAPPGPAHLRDLALDTCDLIVVADFTRVADYAQRFGDDALQIGNFFVPRRRGRRREAA